MTTFNIDAFRAKISDSKLVNNPDSIRNLFQEELFDWIDCFNETLKDCPTSPEALQAKKSIIKLWIDYGSFEKNLKQYKKAVQVYEDAINEPISGSSCDIYIAFSDYYREREKPSSAKKTIIKGLCTKTMSQEDSDHLWNYFLSMMHEENRTNDLTIEQLYEAVRLQLKELENDLIPPSSEFKNKFIILQSTGSQEIFEGRISHDVAESKESDHKVAAVSYSHSFDHTSVAPSQPPISSIEVRSEAKPLTFAPVLDEIDSLGGLSPDLLIKLHSYRPPVLFSAPDKEPMSWGFVSLAPSDIQTLENFLGCSLSSLSSMPVGSKAAMYLDIIESMWTVQALKERDFDNWFSILRDLHLQEEAKLKSNLNYANSTNVQEITKAEIELQKHSKRCLVQRELLHAIVNRTFHKLLLEQERCLMSMGFPLFVPDVIKGIEDCIASAMSQTSATVNQYQKNSQLADSIAHQSVLVNAILSTRLVRPDQSFDANSSTEYMVPPAPPSLRRMSSVENDRSGDWTRGQDGTKRRRRRRQNNTGFSDNVDGKRNKVDGHQLEDYANQAFPMFTVPDINSIAMQHQLAGQVYPQFM